MRLKPCPFCYIDDARMSHRTNKGDEIYQVICLKCGTRGPVFIERAWAEQAWNQLARTVDWPKEK